MTGRGSVLVFYGVVFSYWTQYSMLRPLIGPHAALMGGAPGEIGLILAAMAVPAGVCAIPFGVVADVLGTGPLLLAGAVTVLVGNGLLAAAADPTGLVLPMALSGLGAMAVWIAVQAVMIARPASGVVGTTTPARWLANLS
ncbi:MAG: hypothetical protein WA971_02995, partial [Microbacterium sp.]